MDAYLPKQPDRSRLIPINIVQGPIDRPANGESVEIGDEKWGAALLSGSLMVGISRAGRVIICPNWKAAIKDPEWLQENSFIIECEAKGSWFNHAGWFSVRDYRIMFEVQNQVCVVALGEDGSVPTSEWPSRRPSYCFSKSSAAHLAVHVSYMELFDDCIMATYSVRKSCCEPERVYWRMTLMTVNF